MKWKRTAVIKRFKTTNGKRNFTATERNKSRKILTKARPSRRKMKMSARILMESLENLGINSKVRRSLLKIS